MLLLRGQAGAGPGQYLHQWALRGERGDDQTAGHHPDIHQCIGSKPRFCQPVAIQAQAGAAGIPGGQEVVVIKMPDADITDLHPPLRFGKVLCDVESRLAIMTTSD